MARTTTVMGGQARLEVLDQRHPSAPLTTADDIVNMLWLPDDSGLVFAVSPIYGVPGIYFFDVGARATRRLVAPTHTTDPAYPQGSDLFVLCSAARTPSGRSEVTYLRFNDVDSVNFRSGPLTGVPQVLRW